jgi:hypothetical protein
MHPALKRGAFIERRSEMNRPALRWLFWTAASFPIAVLSHELAHYAAYRAFGFQGASLHYGSASYAVSDAFWARMREGDILAASRLLPPRLAGLAAAAGLLATYATVAACVIVARKRPHPFWVGLGLIAPLRFLGSVAVVLGVMLGRRRASGSDEEHVASTLHIPELALHAFGIVVLVAAWAFLLRIPSRHVRWGRLAVLAGIVVGGILYIGVVGPWLLP